MLLLLSRFDEAAADLETALYLNPELEAAQQLLNNLACMRLPAGHTAHAPVPALGSGTGLQKWRDVENGERTVVNSGSLDTLMKELEILNWVSLFTPCT